MKVFDSQGGHWIAKLAAIVWPKGFAVFTHFKEIVDALVFVVEQVKGETHVTLFGRSDNL
jgi:hypothetical protein